MKTFFRQILGDLAGGRVLDVATKDGDFVRILAESLKNYSEIIGIDISGQAIRKAESTYGQKNIQFIQMDAAQMDLANESFDTVSISASLHHLASITTALLEMKRVLRPGGHFLLAEVHSDGQTDAQLTSVYLHQWVGAVDSALGDLHNNTLARHEFVSYINDLDLDNVTFHDFCDMDTDPMDATRIEQLEDLIDRTIQRAESISSYRTLKERGDDLRQRLHKVGAQREPVLVAIGKKR